MNEEQFTRIKQSPRQASITDIEDLCDEVERLTAALAIANSHAERFERGWYLRGDALEKLQQWATAYPIDVFPEPNLNDARIALERVGITLDAVSAYAMRHVILQTKKIVDAALDA